jgi:hypothetical protein
MTREEDRAVAARLTELEATVRGLTQELVSAEERIRQLEAALEGGADGASSPPATKATPDGEEAGTDTPPADATAEAAGDLDDIIVA